MYTKESIELVKEGADIVKLIGGYCELKPRGRDFWCCCPFHKEKTPSLKVDSEKGAWHCFGCGEGGDAISFIMKMESLGFPEAVEKLASMVGISLEGQVESPPAEPSTAEKLRNACETAAYFFGRCLFENSEESREALDYLRSRGLSEAAIRRWELGFAPSQRRIDSYLVACNCDEDSINAISRFHGRVIFPIRGEDGKMLGFAARSLDGRGPKYLNSMESADFHKKQILYGLDRAKDAIAETGSVILVEGYMDVITIHEAGIRNVVACMGTAFSEETATMLSLLADNEIALLFDGDDAGKHAASRSLELVRNMKTMPCKRRFRIIELPDGLDPADFIQKRGTDELRKLLGEEALSCSPWKQDNVSLGEQFTPERPSVDYQLPPMSLLKVSGSQKRGEASASDFSSTAAALQQTLQDFNINATVIDWIAGPTVTLFKIDLPDGVHVSKLTALNDDIAHALATTSVRIFAPIPSTNYVGIEVPNRQRQNVLLGDVLREAKGGSLEMAIGKDVEGNSIISDLATMPHLLIGGINGSGMSVSINAMIVSVLMRATPAEVRFILIGTKRLELALYSDIPHLYAPVITEWMEAASVLSWSVSEMERRLKVLGKAGARNIGQYNAKAQSGQLEDEGAVGLQHIVIVVAELAELMMNVREEVEFSISRIAQFGRAAGIHLIVATQRPSANVVTGPIKANIPHRIAFSVASRIDSCVILDTPGAENLILLGDLLFSKPELASPQRIQGCYVSVEEIGVVVDYLKKQGKPKYHPEIPTTNLVTLRAPRVDSSGRIVFDDDPLLWDAAEIVVASGLGSTSMIQRKLKVGYSRA